MKSLWKALSATALVAALVAGGFGQANAAPIISISPATQTVGLNTGFTVDILVSGLDGTAAGAVGGFSGLLSFNDALVTGVSYVVDPDAKMGVALDPGFNDLSFGFGAGGSSPLDLFFIADITLDGAALAALQGNAFRLATVSFTTGVTEGLTALALSVVTPGGTFLSDALGSNLPAAAVNGSVCVSRDGSQTPCQAVPEPGLVALMGVGLVALASRRLRKA